MGAGVTAPARNRLLVPNVPPAPAGLRGRDAGLGGDKSDTDRKPRERGELLLSAHEPRDSGRTWALLGLAGLEAAVLALLVGWGSGDGATAGLASVAGEPQEDLTGETWRCRFKSEAVWGGVPAATAVAPASVNRSRDAAADSPTAELCTAPLARQKESSLSEESELESRWGVMCGFTTFSESESESEENSSCKLRTGAA